MLPSMPVRSKAALIVKWRGFASMSCNPTGYTYNELEGLTKLLKYNNDKIGCCGMVYHPEFKDRSYPITVFTNMDFDKLKNILNNL